MGKYLIQVRKIISFLLTICALLSLNYLFRTIYTDFNLYENTFTQITAMVLAVYVIVKMITSKNIKHDLRNVLFDLAFIIIFFTISDANRVFQTYLVTRQLFVMIKFLLNLTDRGVLWNSLANNPAVVLLVSFLMAIVLGGILLMLPAATVSGERTSLLGALFTSTSATCVTGLIVYDTGSHFTIFGQLIILFLIQVGGLGIMTISSAFAVIMGQRMSVKRESMMQSMVGSSNKLDMRNLIRSIVIATVLIEMIGALILYFTFHHEFYSVKKAVYFSVFHSVSAFCNAGFSVYENSFMDFKFNLNINFVITSLIIIGGIGFPVITDVRRNIFTKTGLKRLTLHSKIVLSTTLILILIGMIGFFIAEYHNLMEGYSISERLFTSYFQSVTTRTAGFNTIDNGGLSMSSIMLTLVMMFIGASPGSTGGGIKTTTLAVIVVSVFAMFDRNRDVNIFHRKVSDAIIKRVMALIAISMLVIFLMTFLLFITDNFSFEQTLFEAISAFGTVGLSMGITSQLSAAGKAIIIFLMYFGRVGPLTLIFAVSEAQEKSHFKFTEEKFSIG